MVKCKVIKSFLRGKMDIHFGIPKWMLFYGGVIDISGQASVSIAKSAERNADEWAAKSKDNKTADDIRKQEQKKHRDAAAAQAHRESINKE